MRSQLRQINEHLFQVRDQIENHCNQSIIDGTQEVEDQIIQINNQIEDQIRNQLAIVTELAIIAELVLHQFGDWDEARWKVFSDENISVTLFLDPVTPKGQSLLQIKGKEKFLTSKSESNNNILVLEWLDEKILTYQPAFGLKVSNYLGEKLIPGTPIYKHFMEIVFLDEPR